MKINKIDSQSKINPLGREIKIGLENSNSKKAVLLIHGFGGKTTNWEYIGQKINEELNLPVYIPRLPGHGTNTSDYLNSSSEQWLRKTIDSYLFLHTEYEEIYAAGLSMGGLLASILASHFEVKKLSLVAPAFFTVNKNIVFSSFIKHFIKKIKTDFKLNKSELNKNEINYHQNYSLYYYPKTLAELYKLIKKGKKAVGNITCPSQVILTTNDEQVNTNQVDKFLNKKMGQFLKDQKIYQKSSHVITNDIEKQKAAADIIEFLAK